MQIKKLLKFLPITVIAAGLAVATSTPPLSLLSNPDYLKNQIFNVDQAVDETEYTDQLDYIRNDVARQTGVTNSVASIKLSDNGSSVSGSSAAIVTKTDGSTLLYMWGNNDSGQLGNGTKVNTSTPTLVDSTPFGSKKITQIALGSAHSAALLEDGSLYMWGKNYYGQLGNGTTADNPTPTPVDSAPFGLNKIKEISLGGSHSAVLLENGSLYMWGYNFYGQLGSNGTANKSSPTLVNSTPFGSKKITQIALGGYYSAALVTETDGSTLLYMWGNNDSGQLGNGTKVNTSTPTLVDSTPFGSKKITQIALGVSFSAALLDDGSLYMWGINEYGQLGNGTTDNTSTPTKVNSTPFGSRKITQIALGNSHSAALLDDSSLYMWGNNRYGQLGNGTSGGNTSTPTIVDSAPFGSKKITQIAFGNLHTSALLEDGSLYMWGNNRYGQLGTGGTANRSNPTWMSQLGKDSHITAKSTITAKNAVDNLWVDNKFNLAGFKNSFNLVNIPDVTDQTFAIDTKPTYNNTAGIVTMNIKIKYYYDENGLIVANTTATPMIISGFTAGPNVVTNITVKTTSVSSIVVDKWLSYVTVDEKINRTKLEEFLNLIDVPADAEFTVTNLKPIIKTGALTFNISTSKIIDGNGNVQNTPSVAFPITLNLTPRITKMTPKTSGYPADLTPTALKAKLVDNNGLVKDINELSKYLTIVAPVDGVQYHLVDNKWDANGGNGTVNFAIYASKYYDTEATERTGSGTIAASKVDFSLTLQREVSTIAVKATMPTNVRVDKFETYVKSTGITVATSKLGEFFDLTNIPSDATFTINNVKPDEYDANFTRNHLTFDLTIDKFNQGSPATPATYTHNYGLTLDIQHQQTVIKAKSTYDKSIRVDKVVNELNTLSGPALVTYLNNYLDMQSIPSNATITLGNITPVDATGILTFNVIPSQIYNANSDLVAPSTNQFNVTLQFGIKHAPTSMTIKASYTKTRVDRFANNVNTLKGEALYAYLVDYVNAVNVEGIKLTAEVISQDNANGKITIKLSVSQYYDADSNLVDGILEATLDFELTPIYIPTSIKKLPESIYSQGLTFVQFKQRLIADGATVVGEQYTLSPTNITFMKKFLIMEYVPDDAVFTLTFIPRTCAIVTTPLSFDLVISKHYDDIGDLISTPRVYNFTLNLMSDDAPIPKTEITTKPDAEVVETPTDFLKSITNADGTYNLEALSKYIDGLNTLPIDGNVITIIENGVNPDGTAYFTLKVSEYYNGADSNPQLNGEYKFTVKTNQVSPVATDDQFPWWWIMIVIGGSGLIAIGAWLVIKKPKY